MLVSDDTIAVIGYSYERGGTEVGLFHIDDFGKLAYQSTYHLRSNDYYSSRNYASRLIGNKLIFYTPLYLSVGAEDPFQSFPAVRRWHKGAKPEEFQRIVSASRVYRPEHEFEPGTAFTPLPFAILLMGVSIATPPPYSARRDACSTFQRIRFTSGLAIGCTAVNRYAQTRCSIACRLMALNQARLEFPAVQSISFRFWKAKTII